MRKRFDRYCRRFACYGVTALLVLALFNLLVDPHGVYRAVSPSGLEPYGKYNTRTAKAAMLARGDCRLLLLGSSRVEVGIDPLHPACQPWGAYNIGLAGMRMYEAEHVVDFALAHNDLGRVVLFLDFFQFNKRGTSELFFRGSRFDPDCHRLQLHVEHLFGATNESLSALARAWHGTPADTTPRGHYRRPVSAQGHRAEFAREISTRLAHPRFLKDFAYSAEPVRILRRIVATCRRREIDLTVVINPVHALYLEAVRSAGLWPDYEQWKRDVVAVLNDDQQRHPHAPSVPLWDFSGYSACTTEPVPPADDRDARMRWSWDSHHYTSALGNLMLDRMFGHTRTRANTPDDFGVLLTPDNIEHHLAQTRAARQRYLRQNQTEVAWVANLARQACAPPANPAH